MSGFQNPNFVKEFAYRTKINYFNLRLLQENDKEETSRIDNALEKTKKEMEKQEFVISDFFEVTQLINSMIGLLVFPEQAYYDFLSEKSEDLEKEYPILYSYVIGQRGKYRNTYYEDAKYQKYKTPERVNSKNVLRHLRNSASHRKLSIFPENGRLRDGTNIIQAVTFKDTRRIDIRLPNGTLNRGKTEQFELTVDVKDLEHLLIEICDGIIKMCK